MYYIIYKITNLISNKIYIGKHKTKNINDYYFGSSVELKKDIKAFGKNNFIKEILYVCSNEKEMDLMEQSIVNDIFILRNDVYNVIPGGTGGTLNGMNIGITHVSKTKNSSYFKKLGKAGANSLHEKLNSDKRFKEEYSGNIILGLKAYYESGGEGGFKNKKHTNKFKKKLSKIMSIKQKGEKNSQFGTCWIYNSLLKQNKKIKKEDIKKYINAGWTIGRKMVY